MTRAETAVPADRVLVVGASVSGMVAALALANRDIPVELVDADPALDPALDPGEADVAPALTGRSGPSEASRRRPRRATPQAGHSHAFLARSRSLLAEEAPDVLVGLLAAGCREVVLAEQRPTTVPLHAAAPGDGELVVLAARRTTYESVLRAAVRRRPGLVTLRSGRRAIGLVVDRGGTVPRVEGVAFDDGSVTRARLVVDASGRRTPMPRWLGDHGIAVADESTECGITYLTRFYQRSPGAPELPLDRGFAAGGSFDSYSCLVFPGDAGTFSVTFGVLPEDRALRPLRDGPAFNAAVRAIPALAPWVDADHAEAISDVRTMAGLLNGIRRVGADAGGGGNGPGLTGWTAVGDAAATTNPAHSRGCTLGAIHAVAVADAVAEHGDDPATLAEACATVVEVEQAPWVTDSIEQDHQRLSRWRPRPDGPDEPAPFGPTGRLGRLGRLTNGETWAAAQHDAYVWRRFTRLQQLFDRPDDVLADPRVVARVRAVQAARPASPALEGPSHAELVELVGATTSVA